LKSEAMLCRVKATVEKAVNVLNRPRCNPSDGGYRCAPYRGPARRM
jgi:hypothetical protein